MQIQFFLLVFLINAAIAIAAELQEAPSFPDKQITDVGVSTKSGRIFVNFLIGRMHADLGRRHWLLRRHLLDRISYRNRFNHLYVADHDRFIGAVSLHDVKNYLNTPELAKVVIARDVLHDSIPVVRPDASLIEALERFRHHDNERLPVVNDSATKRLIGTIAKTDVFLALAGSTTRSATTVASAPSQ